MELALPESSSPSSRGGSQECIHAYRATVGGIQGGGGVCGGLCHEHQVEVWGVGGVEEDLSQHGALRAHRQRWSSGERKHVDKVMESTDPFFIQPAQFSIYDTTKRYKESADVTLRPI